MSKVRHKNSYLELCNCGMSLIKQKGVFRAFMNSTWLEHSDINLIRVLLYVDILYSIQYLLLENICCGYSLEGLQRDTSIE